MDAEVKVGIGILGVSATLFAAWCTHVYVCLAAGSWGFLIAGAVAAPVAWVHGIGYWFGIWG